MIRRPPRSTRTDTLFPYTTLFRSLLDNARAVPISAGMTISADPRSLLYGLGLDPDAAIRLTAQALARSDDGELYLQYRKSESFGFDDGRLKTASYDRQPGFGLRAVSDRKSTRLNYSPQCASRIPSS